MPILISNRVGKENNPYLIIKLQGSTHKFMHHTFFRISFIWKQRKKTSKVRAHEVHKAINILAASHPRFIKASPRSRTGTIQITLVSSALRKDTEMLIHQNNFTLQHAINDTYTIIGSIDIVEFIPQDSDIHHHMVYGSCGRSW